MIEPGWTESESVVILMSLREVLLLNCAAWGMIVCAVLEWMK
jgi:hypothetical protein